MQSLSLMDRFSDPVLFEQLTGGEKLQGALLTTLMGMGLTFVVLILLWAIIAMMTKLLNKNSVDAMIDETPVTSKASTVAEENSMGDAQLIAVIMAAIAASEGKEFKNNLIVRKINRISGHIPAWRNAGQVETIDSRRI